MGRWLDLRRCACVLRRASTRLRTLAAVALVAACAWPAGELAVSAFASAPKASNATAELRSWSALRADASALLGRRIKLVAQLHGRVEAWNPYLSRFGPRTHAAIQLWADEQMLWRMDEHDAPQVRVFVPLGSAAESVLARGARYERFEIEGTLRELFLGEPWIEVEYARRLPEQVGEGTVIHAGRALSLMDSGVWKLAEAELGQALQSLLPAHARAELERLRESCRKQELPQDGSRASRPWNGDSTPVRIRRGSSPDLDG